MFFNDPIVRFFSRRSVASTLRWLGRNVSALPFAFAALFTVWLSAEAFRHWALWLLALFAWCLAGGVASVFYLLSLWIPGLRPGVSNARLAMASIALSLSVVTLNWPLRLTFLVSRPALERIAANVRAGRTVAVPRRVGLFTIERAEIPAYTKMGVPKTGVVCLWTEYDTSGSEGFVQCAPDEGFFNIQSRTVLTPRWQFIAED